MPVSLAVRSMRWAKSRGSRLAVASHMIYDSFKNASMATNEGFLNLFISCSVKLSRLSPNVASLLWLLESSDVHYGRALPLRPNHKLSRTALKPLVTPSCLARLMKMCTSRKNVSFPVFHGMLDGRACVYCFVVIVWIKESKVIGYLFGGDSNGGSRISLRRCIGCCKMRYCLSHGCSD